MPKITFQEPSGQSKTINATVGETLMMSARNHGVEGIIAECGGCLSCATCHVYVNEDWVSRLPAPAEDEKIMVECAIGARANSRLSCQIVITEHLDGLLIEVPSAQE